MGGDVAMVIAGARFEVWRDGAVVLEGVFEMDETVVPKAITWIDATGADAGKRLLGSYELEGDRFRFIAADAGAARPLEFRTEVGLVMRGFVRG